MRKSIIAVFLCLFSAAAFAQVSYVTVTATVTDPTGAPFSNARLIARLVDKYGNPVYSASTPNGQLYNAKPVQATLDSTGHFSIQIVPNTVLSSPSGTQWQIALSAPADLSTVLTLPLPWGVVYSASISGAVDLSSQISALSQPINFVNLNTGQTTFKTTTAFGCGGSGGSVNCSGAISAATLAASCSQVFATGDTRCHTGADFGQRMNDCLSGSNKPLNGICDGSSEVGTPTINSTVNIKNGMDLKLPQSVTCNVSPCFEADTISSWSIAGLSAAVWGRTKITMTVHGAVLLINGQNDYVDVGQMSIDYTRLGTFSSDPDDKPIVISGGSVVDPIDLKFHDIFFTASYDGIFDGNCTSATTPACVNNWTGTGSNVIDITDVKGYRLGNSLLTFGLVAGGPAGAIHDQITIVDVGVDTSADLSGQGVFYFSSTNHINWTQGFLWHVNWGVSAGSVPSGWIGVQFSADHNVIIKSFDFEVDFMYGGSQFIYVNAANASFEDVTSYNNTWGGTAGGGAAVHQSFIHISNNANSVVHLKQFQPNLQSADTCSAPNASPNYEVLVQNLGPNPLYVYGMDTDWNALPAGTNCSPSTYDTGVHGTTAMSGLWSSPDGTNYVLPSTATKIGWSNGTYNGVFAPPASLTAARTWAMQDGSGTVAFTAQLPVTYTPSWTPAAATASSCAEQTLTVTGLTTSQTLLGVNPPASLGAHVWVGGKRISAANTAAVTFCADATAGTPPSGAWRFVAF